MPSPRVPRHKVSLLRAGKVSLCPPCSIQPLQQHTEPVSPWRICRELPSLAVFLHCLNKRFLDTQTPTVPSVKIFMDNLNNYLNYTRHLDLGRSLKMFLPLLCLQFLSMRNKDIYPKTQDFMDLGSRPLSFWNDFSFFCHLTLCTIFHAGKSIFQDVFCLRKKKISCLLATLRVMSALLEVQSRRSNR